MNRQSWSQGKNLQGQGPEPQGQGQGHVLEDSNSVNRLYDISSKTACDILFLALQ